MDVAQAQAWVDEVLDQSKYRATGGAESAGAPPEVEFSPFVAEDALRAREAARQLMFAADAEADDGRRLSAVAQKVDELLRTEGRGAVRFALKLFLSHHPAGRGVRIPALERQAPFKVVPSADVESGVGAEAVGADEARLNWWREDPEANEHHDHWHVVYPTRGIPDPTPENPGRTRLKDRQGELFFYMHQQMLARYDTERIAVGLGRVEPLSDYGAPIPEGYDPTSGLTGFPEELWTPAGAPRPRPDGARMPPRFVRRPGEQPLLRADLDVWHERLESAARTGILRDDRGEDFTFTDPDPLGHATEPASAGSPAAPGQHVPDRGHYGSFHGRGHVLLSAAAGTPQGVMADTDTAIRDPVFYRWHRHIDDLFATWQQTRQPHPLTDVAAPVALRRAGTREQDRPAESPDIVLLRGLPAGLTDAELAAQVTEAIGGQRFDDDVADTAPGTAELRTEMRTRPLDIAGVDDAPVVTIPYLDQEEFAYAVRMRNTAGTDHNVTVRLFVVADELFDQRRMWIELDKFSHQVRGETSVAVRHARASAVIRKPGLKPPGPTRHSRTPGDTDDHDAYCECGWPYNLLLPRGTGNGMRFWIAAIITDGAKDSVQESTCGSMSFCGARDRYPDARPMGYPFDRPLVDDDVATALDSLPSIAARSFVIRWSNPGFSVS